MEPLETYQQGDRHLSPRPKVELLVCFLWQICWWLFCAWTPRPLNSWRLLWLRLFGAKVSGQAFVHQHARISIPWRLAMHAESCIGDGAVIYNIALVELAERCVVAQEAYLCTATHDLSNLQNLPLQCAPIRIGKEAFVGARAFILPGVQIGAGAVVGACAVVTKDLEPMVVAVGNPARVVGKRKVLTALPPEPFAEGTSGKSAGQNQDQPV